MKQIIQSDTIQAFWRKSYKYDIMDLYHAFFLFIYLIHELINFIFIRVLTRLKYAISYFTSIFHVYMYTFEMYNRLCNILLYACDRQPCRCKLPLFQSFQSVLACEKKEDTIREIRKNSVCAVVSTVFVHVYIQSC